MQKNDSAERKRLSEESAFCEQRRVAPQNAGPSERLFFAASLLVRFFMQVKK